MMLNVSHDAVKEKHVVDKKELWIRYAVRSTESFVFFVYRVLSAPENEITNTWSQPSHIKFMITTERYEAGNKIKWRMLNYGEAEMHIVRT